MSVTFFVLTFIGAVESLLHFEIDHGSNYTLFTNRDPLIPCQSNPTMVPVLPGHAKHISAIKKHFKLSLFYTKPRELA